MTAWPEGYARRVLQDVDSTNAEAFRRAAALVGPEWIMAHRQSGARGRGGRAWVTPAGNFSATLVLSLNDPPAQVALRSFVAALALRDALCDVADGDAALTLKWPNDVLLSGGKVAGILLERAGPHLAIGIGVNLIAAPSAAEVEARALRPVSVLAETGRRILPEVMLDALAAAYEARESEFTTWGFAPIRTAWLAHAAKLGETITARTGHQQRTGVFETVDDEGQLVLKTPEGRVHVAAADVFF